MAATQNEKIYDYLTKHPGITQRDAIELGVYRLSARIHDLKDLGINIDSKMIDVKNRDGETVRVAFYSLRKGEA